MFSSGLSSAHFRVTYPQSAGERDAWIAQQQAAALQAMHQQANQQVPQRPPDEADVGGLLAAAPGSPTPINYAAVA